MNEYPALGVSIYAGGHAIGVARQGFRIVGHLEEGDFGVATFRANFPRVPVHVGHDNWPVGAYRNRVSWVYSNPPCAPWSQAGRTMHHGRDGWRTDPRVEHTLHAFEVLERVHPVVWSWESVQRTYTVGAEVVDHLTYRALAMGYAVTHFLTDWQLHGLPQRRARFFFVAHRVALEWPEPADQGPPLAEALHGVAADWCAPMPQEWRAVVSVLRQGEYLRAKWEALNEVPTGTAERVKGRPPYTIHRLYADQVCSTITSMRAQLHPTENRYLANSEVGRVQGYPGDYRWVGAPSSVQEQMAKAVTPLAAGYLAAVVREGLDRGVSVQPSVSVVDFRRPAGNRPLRRVG